MTNCDKGMQRMTGGAPLLHKEMLRLTAGPPSTLTNITPSKEKGSLCFLWLEGVCKQSELKSGNKEDTVCLTSIYHLVCGEQELCVAQKQDYCSSGKNNNVSQVCINVIV